jgi:hypothetical protein
VNAEQLNGVLNRLATAHTSGGTPKKIDQLRGALDAIANNSNDAQAQTDYQQRLQALADVLSSPPLNQFSLRELKIIEETGLEHLIGNNLQARVTEVHNSSQLTPRLAHDAIVPLRDKLNTTLASIGALAKGMNELGISHGDPDPGEAELGMFIPRHGENLKLGAIVDEGQDLDRLVGMAYEIAEGKTDSPEVSFLTSCDYGYLVIVSSIALKFLLGCIEKALDITIKAAAAKRALEELRGKGHAEDADVDKLIEKALAKQRTELQEMVKAAVTETSKADAALQNDQIARLTNYIEKFIEKRETRGNYVDLRVNIEAAPADGEDAKATQARIVVQQQLSVIGQHIVALETNTPPVIAAIAAPAAE